ncbi:MAG: hypothetical protein Q9219_004875 [cf. Caloplaca sp. 3 TL-2023]
MSGPEILVHAAAPSRGSDDARYRKEASGILSGFEIVKRHPVLSRLTEDQRKDVQESWIDRDSNAHQALAQDSIASVDPTPRHHLTNAFTTWLTPTLASPSPQLLVSRTPVPPPLPDELPSRTPNFQVKRTPADQPRPKTAPSGPFAIQETPHLPRSFSDSFETPPSFIEDSQPTLSTQNHGKRPFEDHSSPSPTHYPPPGAKRKKRGAEEELEIWTQPEDTSTPPPSNNPQPASSANPDSTSATPPLTPPPHIQPPTAARRERHHAKEQSETWTPPLGATSTPPLPNNPSPPSPSIPNNPSPSPSTIYRRRETLPPRPKPGTGPFTTHLTRNLLLLQKHCPTFLQTVTPTRPITTLERGHWCFDIPAFSSSAAAAATNKDDDGKGKWDEAAREEMWGFLVDFVGGGGAGWGVWAVFEEFGGGRLLDVAYRAAHDGVGEESGWDGDTAARGGGGGGGSGRGVVRVYCWGEVVAEVYTVLVLATRRKIKRCGAKWIDARGEVVVDMG